MKEKTGIYIDEYTNIRANTYIFSLKTKYCTDFETIYLGSVRVALTSSTSQIWRLIIFFGGRTCMYRIILRTQNSFLTKCVVEDYHNILPCGSEEAQTFWLRMTTGQYSDNIFFSSNGSCQ